MIGAPGRRSPNCEGSLLRAFPEGSLARLRPFGVRDMLLCPLIVRGRCWGVLTLVNIETEGFDGGMFEAIDLIARSLSNALERAELTKLLDAAKRSSRAAIAAFATPSPPEERWREALGEVAKTVDSSACCLVDDREVYATSDAPIPLACREIAHRLPPDMSSPRIADDISTKAAGVEALVLAISESPRRSLVFFRNERSAKAALEPSGGAEVVFERRIEAWDLEDVARAAVVQEMFVQATRARAAN